MKALPLATLLLVLAATASTTGCASSCSATPDKLAALKRGMSYDEATAVMGCPGTQVGTQVTHDDLSTVEWDGPDRGVVSRTQLDFRDGRLLS
ncbi:MAG: hypothetical protein WCP68_07160, partial [Enhydrobacter sp.]